MTEQVSRSNGKEKSGLGSFFSRLRSILFDPLSTYLRNVEELKTMAYSEKSSNPNKNPSEERMKYSLIKSYARNLEELKRLALKEEYSD